MLLIGGHHRGHGPDLSRPPLGHFHGRAEAKPSDRRIGIQCGGKQISLGEFPERRQYQEYWCCR
jgi:hypothetical protein